MSLCIAYWSHRLGLTIASIDAPQVIRLHQEIQQDIREMINAKKWVST